MVLSRQDVRFAIGMDQFGCYPQVRIERIDREYK